MAFAWSVIDGIVHGPDLLLADGGEAGALGETLTNQPVGVPVAAAPPWMECVLSSWGLRFVQCFSAV